MKHLKLLLVIIGVMMLANGSASAGEYDLHQAVLDNDLQLVQRLLSKGKAIDVIGSRKYGYGSALHLAVREGHVDIAQVLIDRGAQVDVLDPDDFTPLHNAAWNGNLEMTELLLAAGADINASTYDGDTPLKLAQNNDQAQIAGFIQAKLQPAPTQQQISKDPGFIDVSGTYLSEFTGDISTQRSPPIQPNTEVRLVQNGNQITGSIGSRGKIWGDIEGDTIKFDFLTSGGDTIRGEWTVKPGGNELVGNWFESWRGSGKWNLTKIDIEPPQLIDVSGTYLVDASGDPALIKYIVTGNPRLSFEGRPVFEVIQSGDHITATMSTGTREFGPIYGVIDGNTIIVNWEDARSKLTISPGGKELDGTVVYSGGDNISGFAELKLAKVESDTAPIPDISGTYIAETTASGSGMNHELIKAFEKLNGKLIVLKQTGNTITGRAKSPSDWIPRAREIKGTRDGNIISFFIIKGNEINGSWEINADATKLEGKWLTNGAGGASGKWNLKRVE